MTKLKTFFAGLLIAASLPLAAAQVEEVPLIVITMNNGSQVSYSLPSKPVITYDVDFIVLTSPDYDVDFPLMDIKNITFGKGAPTAVSDVKTTVGTATTMGATVNLKGFDANSPVNVFTISGQQVGNYNVDAAGNLSISLDHLAKGIYIIQTNNISQKVIIK